MIPVTGYCDLRHPLGFHLSGTTEGTQPARSCGDQPGRRSARRAVDSLFRRFAVEVLVVGLRVLAGMVDDAVPMIRRRIERIELQWNTVRYL